MIYFPCWLFFCLLLELTFLSSSHPDIVAVSKVTEVKSGQFVPVYQGWMIKSGH